MPVNPEDYGPSQSSLTTETLNRSWQPVHWRDQYSEMVRQSVDGVPVARIVRNFKRHGVSYSAWHIRRIIGSQRGQELAALMRIEKQGGAPALQERLSNFAPEAIGTELDILRNPFAGERHRLVAAQDILDRGGIPKISRQEGDMGRTQVININLSPEQLASLLKPAPILEAKTVELPELPPDE